MSIFFRRQRVRYNEDDLLGRFIYSLTDHLHKIAIKAYIMMGACAIGGLGLLAGLGYLAFKGVPLLSAIIGAAAGVSTIAGGGILFAGIVGAALVTTGLVFGIKAIVKAVKNRKKYKNQNKSIIKGNYKERGKSVNIEKSKISENKTNKLNEKTGELENNKNKLESFQKAKNEISQVYSFEKKI